MSCTCNANSYLVDLCLRLLQTLALRCRLRRAIVCRLRPAISALLQWCEQGGIVQATRYLARLSTICSSYIYDDTVIVKTCDKEACRFRRVRGGDEMKSRTDRRRSSERVCISENARTHPAKPLAIASNAQEHF